MKPQSVQESTQCFHHEKHANSCKYKYNYANDEDNDIVEPAVTPQNALSASSVLNYIINKILVFCSF